MNNKTHLVTSLAVASLACLWLFIPGAKGLAADNYWYIESGKKIIDIQFDFENIIFSPLYSLIAFAFSSMSLNSTASFFVEVIGCFLFSALTWYLLLAIPRFVLMPMHSESAYIGTIRGAFFVSLFIFNPVLLKYSLPILSDSYSLIGGTLFTFFHGIDVQSLNLSSRQATHKVDPITITLLTLHKKPALYFSLIILLCLFRYGNFFLLCSSLFFYFSTHERISGLRPNYRYLRWIRLSLLSSLAAIFITILKSVSRFYSDWNSALLSYPSIFLMPEKLAQKLLMVFILTIGGREGFRWAIDYPIALFDFNSLQAQYSLSGYRMSLQEYLFSLAYLSLMLIAFVFSLFGMWRFCKKIILPYILGITLLLITELAINVAHQRYFLPFLPSLYFGLFLLIYYKQLDSDVWKVPNGC